MKKYVEKTCDLVYNYIKWRRNQGKKKELGRSGFSEEKIKTANRKRIVVAIDIV